MFRLRSVRLCIIVLFCLCLVPPSFRTLSLSEFAVCDTQNGTTENLLHRLGSTYDNQISGFNATGQNYRGEGVSLTQDGGTIELSGTKVYFKPWKHLFWTEQNMDAFFLANVTENNFCIAFLYFVNGSTSFELGIFEYAPATYQMFSYSGKATVFQTQSGPRPTSFRKLSLAPLSQTENKIYATGPDIFIVGNYGYLKENSSVLNLYALRNTINPKSGWNELWALLVGNSGDYYFSIIYMNAKDKNNILLGHTLRLNDYYVLEQRSLTGTWSGKVPTYQLFVNTPQDARLFWVDGFRFERRDNSPFSIALNQGLHAVGVENITIGNGGVRLKFNHWSDGSTGNPLTLNVKSNETVSAEFSKEFLLTIQSAYSGVMGSGWYPEGQTVPITTPGFIENEDTKGYFEGWSGDVDTGNNSTSVTMDSPKTLHANWQTFFRVVLATEGLPEGTLITYTLNGQETSSQSAQNMQEWAPENSTLYFNITFPGTQTESTFFLKDWRNQYEAEVTSPILLTGPERLVAVFTNHKQPTQLFCSVSISSLLSTGRLMITGRITPPAQAKVNIECRVSGEPWRILAGVETDEQGQYRYEWEPDRTGLVQIRAVMPGDASLSAATSDPQVVAISQSMLRFGKLAATFGDTSSSLYDELNGPKPVADASKAFFTFGMWVSDAAYFSLAHFKPLGPVVAIITGSALIGLFYVFPWASIILLLAVIVTKRSISKRVTLLLIVVWVLSFSYLVLEELNVTDPISPSHYLLTVFTASLASSTGILIGLLPSLRISNTLAKYWQQHD